MTTTIGEVRPSQLLWTYGPGGLIDMPNLSVVTQGIDHEKEDYCMPINEARHRRRTTGPRAAGRKP